jgi:hypothetical protein
VPGYYQTHKVKTLMTKKNLISQANDSANSVAELIELSDEALSGVRGGEIDVVKNLKLGPVPFPISPCDPLKVSVKLSSL